jgi:hypothetical protein
VGITLPKFGPESCVGVIMADAISPQALSELIGSIYDCALDPAHWERTLADLVDGAVEMKVRRGPTYSPAVPHILTGRPPVTNPFDLPSRLREGNGLLLSGTMNGAGRRLEELARVYADRSTAPPAALHHYNWRRHCRGLFQIPIAA